MKFQEIKTRGPEELERMLKEQKDTLHKLQFDMVAGKVKNVNQLKITRRTIARILTLQNQNRNVK